MPYAYIFSKYIKQHLTDYIATDGEQFIPFSKFESYKYTFDEVEFELPYKKLSIIQDESFSEMIVRKIHELGISNSECYKKARVDRRHFSKILSNPHYKPTKQTVLSFALALELTLDESNEMLAKAGYCLSKSIKFDLIIEYFIKNEEYNILLINQALHYYNQPLL